MNISLILAYTLRAILAYAHVSAKEYYVHKVLMHSQRPAKLAKGYLPRMYQGLWDAYHNHAFRHHYEFYAKKFTHEPDPIGREIGIPVGISNSILVLGPDILIAWFIDRPYAVILLILTVFHNVMWTKFHRAMHDETETVWWTRTWWFKASREYHYLHHRQQGKNFNAFYPLWDWLLGTQAEMRPSDKLEIENNTWRVRVVSKES